MPTLANLTVKKNDGTTDIVYTGVQPSSGDGSPAIWKSATVGNAPAHQPELRLVARDAKKGASRALRGTFKYPQIATNSTTGITSVIGVASGAVDWELPKSMAVIDINEFAAQFGNLMAQALIKACVQAGYAAS